MRIAENAGTPLYASAFVNDDTFVVGGGGGQGAHGVANKLVAYRIKGAAVEQVDELLLPENSDTPTSMASGSAVETVWVGANVPSKGQFDHITHISLSKMEKLVAQDSYNFFKSSDPAIYQRSTSVAGNTVAATSSANPGAISIYNFADKDLLTMTFDEELVGAAIADYDEKTQKYVAAASETHISIRTIGKPNTNCAQLSAPEGTKWARIAAIGPGKFVAASTIGVRKGAALTVLEILYSEKGELVLEKQSIKIPGFKGVTALGNSGSHVAIASAAGEVLFYDVGEGVCDKISRIAQFKNVHKFPVTSLCVSCDGTCVLSTSLDGSLVAHTKLGYIKSSLRATIGWVTLSTIIIAILAILVGYIIQNSYEVSQKVVNIPLTGRRSWGHGPVVHSHLEYESFAADESKTYDPEQLAYGVAGTAPEASPETPVVEATVMDATHTPEEKRADPTPGA